MDINATIGGTGLIAATPEDNSATVTGQQVETGNSRC